MPLARSDSLASPGSLLASRSGPFEVVRASWLREVPGGHARAARGQARAGGEGDADPAGRARAHPAESAARSRKMF